MTHSHSHAPSHSHRVSTAPPPGQLANAETTGPSQGPVVLDIGGAVGAAVVRTSHELDGSEIEIRRLPSDWDGTHVAVRSRPSASAPVYAAVFGQLEEGSYELRRRPAAGDGYVHRLEVLGGQVVDTTWPEAGSPA
jgi:hypothetical protein